VLAQRFASLELIVVDNSTDPKANADLRRRYRDPRFRYVFEPVQGLSHARNRGTALARGRYVAFLDDDAIAKPDWAEMLVDGFRKLGGQTACIGGRIVPRWLAPRPDWLTRNLLGYLSIVDWGGKLRPLRKKEWIAGCNIAFERKALQDANGFPTALCMMGNGAALL
jgi:glycosyltransferase involved in cell wall biosynthesis